MDISWIEDGVLAASPLPQTADNLHALHKQGIRAIITLTERPLTVNAQLTPALLKELDITPLHVAIDDLHPPNKAQVEQIVAFIDRMKAEGRPVLLHCKVGQGRTGTLLHAYFMAKGYPLADARVKVSARRPLCDFMQLSDTQRAFLQEYAAGLILYV